jgi:plasmid stabilization system protein ParE
VIYEVILTDAAREDLIVLYRFVLEREMELEGGDLSLAGHAYDEILAAISSLAKMPFICRRADQDPSARELVVPFGATGYVVLFEVDANDTVVVSAIRHQRQAGYSR